MPCVEEANEACAFPPHPLHYPHRSKCRRDIFHVFQPGSEESIHMWSRSHRDQWRLLTINDCLHKFSRVVNLHSFHCVYTYAEVASIQQPSFNTNDKQLLNARPWNNCRPALGSRSAKHKGQASCNPTELFHPYPKGHLAYCLPKHILKLQIIGAVWY